MLDVRESLTQQDKIALHVISYTEDRPQWRPISPIYFRAALGWLARGWLAGPNRLGSGPTGGVSPRIALGPPATVDLLFQTNDVLLFETTPEVTPYLPPFLETPPVTFLVPLQKFFCYVISAIPAAIACDVYAYYS
jgi:hypothetical protein